jgi:pterin-4a-carbinolamine dehydratase
MQVFVNYRRDSDSLRASLVSLQIQSALAHIRPGEFSVFRDTQTRVGKNWPAEIRAQLEASDVVIAIMGPASLTATDAFGRRRIDQPDDWVRQELERALDHDKALIPVVFGEAMPPREALPEVLGSFVERQAAFVADETLDRDLEPVYLELKRIIGGDDKSQLPVAQPGQQLPYPQPPMKLPPPAISEQELEPLLADELPDWQITKNPVYGKPAETAMELRREFNFKTFRDAISFMSEIAEFADATNHHPRWENIFRTLVVHLSTWDIAHRVSVLDLMLAAYFDRRFAEYSDSGD